MEHPKLINDLSLKTGDIIGYVGAGPLSDFINVVTLGIPRVHYSHVGVVLVENSIPYVVEALNSKKQVVMRPLIESLTTPAWAYPIYRRLFSHEYERIEKILRGSIGTPYDKTGAFWSGGVLTRLVGLSLFEESKARFFCSELAAYALSESGLFVTANFSSWSPNSLIRRGRLRGIFERPVRLPDAKCLSSASVTDCRL